MRHKESIDFSCHDCGHDCRRMDEMYMVWDVIWAWATYEHGSARLLCIGCLELRLGRQLRPRDFTQAPINWDGERPRSLRLRHRLGYSWGNTGLSH